MSAKKKKDLAVRRIVTGKTVVHFDAERLKAPFLLRCGAFLIDYIILVCVPVTGLIFGRAFGMDGTKLLNSEISNTGWLIMFLLGLTNFVILPTFSGQSIGKMLTGLRIVSKDGHLPSLKALILRHTLGYLLTFLTFGVGFFISVFSVKGRALQDLIAGTIVIYGEQKIKNKISE
jgi:uncharacterized RDD family membrane protein YckC